MQDLLPFDKGVEGAAPGASGVAVPVGAAAPPDDGDVDVKEALALALALTLALALSLETAAAVVEGEADAVEDTGATSTVLIRLVVPVAAPLTVPVEATEATTE